MNSEIKTKRLFLGLPLSQTIKDKVRGLQLELPSEGFKPVKPEILHLTLKFLGEVREEKLPKIKDLLKSLDLGKRFLVKVRTVGAFPNENYVRVIWFGLEDDEEIFTLHKKIDFGLSKLFPVEKDFLAHVTLARVKFVKDKEKLKEFLERFKKTELGEMKVEKVVLYESILSKEGPEYKILEEYLLS